MILVRDDESQQSHSSRGDDQGLYSGLLLSGTPMRLAVGLDVRYDIRVFTLSKWKGGVAIT